MELKTQFLQAWRGFLQLKKHRPEPTWARLLISAGIGLAFALLFTLVPALVLGHLFDPAWLSATFRANLIISLTVSYTIHLLFRAIELLLPETAIARITQWRGWRAALFFAAVPVTGSMLGLVLGMFLVGQAFQFDALGQLSQSPQSLRIFALLTLLITAANAVWWKVRNQQQALRLAATEAQLRLLQAQIEPHFLFNTLANVQSLIDYDAPRAKQMLESFTDYLRASLGALRQADSTLGAELDMAESYLRLLQIRMNERLRFEIDADQAARAAVLAPLLLQPLIENAIHHGLEPKVEGGCVRVTARLEAGQLVLSVADDGLGLDAPRRPGRPGRTGSGTGTGTGLALGNIRARLSSRYGHNASLTVSAQPVGTLACLSLPYLTQ